MLLGSLVEENFNDRNGTFEQIQETRSTQTDPEQSLEEVTESEKQSERHDESEDLDEVQEDQNTTLPELDTSTESHLIKDVESITKAVPDYTEEGKKDLELELESALETGSETDETKDTPTESKVDTVPKEDLVDEPVSASEGVQIPELKTTLGTTFDAITSDDEITTKVTPYIEEDSEDVQNHPEDDNDKVPLLSFTEENVDAPALDSFTMQESLPTTEDDKPKMTEEKNMWTSLGDAVFSVVTGVETTGEDLSSDEDDDEDQEKEAAAKTSRNLEKEETEPLSSELQTEPENIEHVSEDPSNSNIVQPDTKETHSESNKPFSDSEEESDQELTGHEEAQNETFKPTDESIQDQTEETIVSVDPESPYDTLKNHDGEKLSVEIHERTQEKEEEEETKHSDISEEVPHVQDSVVTEQVLDIVFDENRTLTDQELAISKNEKDQERTAEKKQTEDPDFKDDKNVIGERLPHQIHDHVVSEVESNSSRGGLSVEDPDIHKQPQIEETEADKEVKTEEEEEYREKEELLEDENALSFSQSDSGHSDKPSPETTQSAASTTEPEYSDSVMRLTLLRDHFTEENMERVQKILSLKNLFKVEAMFSDLDQELQATRMTHTSTTQDIENALEHILETSENAILDEIEKMLDNRDTKKDDDQNVDKSSLDEETELLDNFQELAFSLRQKYSTASDSVPLATEESPDSEQGRFDLLFALGFSFSTILI